MKTVSGKLISYKPVSLSKAAKILSGFAGHDHGASDAVSVYLNRTADAFNDLVSFHKDLKNAQSHLKHRTPRSKIEGDLVVGKVEIRESRKKIQKNADIVKIEEPLKVEEFRTGLAFEGNGEKDFRNKRTSEKDGAFREEIGEKRINEKLKMEKSKDIEQVTPDQVGEKRKKKNHKREKLSNAEAINIEPTQVLDECGKGKKNKQDTVGIVQHADEIEEGTTKKGEKRGMVTRVGKT